MNTVTIKKNITKGDELVVMPRKAYERFLAVYEKHRWDAKEREADSDIAAGRLSRSYRTKKELRDALNRLKK